MNTASNSEPFSNNLSEDLSEISHLVQAAADSREGDCLALLELLRLLDELHYDIRETLFRDALPDNRQRLYRLLRDIEQQGGWPYIPRMKLSALFRHLEEIDSGATALAPSDAEPEVPSHRPAS